MARPRNPVPAELESRVSIVGYEGLPVRFMGDQPDAQVQREAVARIRQWNQERGDEPIRILCLSSGGSDGAFGAGVLCGWTAAGTRPKFQAITGVSTGAFLAVFAFAGPDYDQRMKQCFTAVSDADIYRLRGLFGLLHADSAADNSPLVALTEKFIDEPLVDRIAQEYRKGRRLYVTSTNLDEQRPVVWDMGAIAASGRPRRVELFRQVLLASAAIPVFFPPIYFDVSADGRHFDEMHVDGGVTSQIFFSGKVFDLSELGRQAGGKTPIQIYVIHNGSEEPQRKVVPAALTEIAEGTIATFIDNQGESDLYRVYALCVETGVEFKYVAIPEDFHFEPGSGVSTFIRAEMTRLFQRGYEMGHCGLNWRDKPRGL